MPIAEWTAKPGATPTTYTLLTPPETGGYLNTWQNAGSFTWDEATGATWLLGYLPGQLGIWSRI